MYTTTYRNAVAGLLLLVGMGETALNQQIDTAGASRVFSLGEVTVLGRRGLDSSNTALSQRIEAFNRLDVGRALNLLLGVTVSSVGARNETVVYGPPSQAAISL